MFLSSVDETVAKMQPGNALLKGEAQWLGQLFFLAAIFHFQRNINSLLTAERCLRCSNIHLSEAPRGVVRTTKEVLKTGGSGTFACN